MTLKPFNTKQWIQKMVVDFIRLCVSLYLYSSMTAEVKVKLVGVCDICIYCRTGGNVSTTTHLCRKYKDLREHIQYRHKTQNKCAAFVLNRAFDSFHHKCFRPRPHTPVLFSHLFIRQYGRLCFQMTDSFFHLIKRMFWVLNVTVYLLTLLHEYRKKDIFLWSFHLLSVL